MMSQIPVLPDTAPFTAEQRAWLNGFLAGVFSRGQVDPIVRGASAGQKPPLKSLTILFGSQTGTSETLAKRTAKEAGKRGHAATVVDMAQFSLERLSQEKNLLLITSTYGDGEPPDNAKALHKALVKTDAKLDGLRFSVLSLGDSNYAQFCRCGKDFDAFLERCGGRRLASRVDCDLDYEEKFVAWLNASFSALAQEAPGSEMIETKTTIASRSEAQAEDIAPGTQRAHPFMAPLLAVNALSGAGSGKQVNHIEFSLADSGLSYEAGDALGVYPQNCPELASEILNLLGCDGEVAVSTALGEMPLRNALTTYYDLGKPTPEMLELFLSVPAGARAGTSSTVFHHVIDVLGGNSGRRPSLADFTRCLKRLQPRLYSISSSPHAHAGQVHLTVGAVRYEVAGRPRKGVCSTYLPERTAAGVKIPVYLHSNKAFKLPIDGSTPIIMVGPGTGIAPFRSFLHERRATGATGDNWLFFGDQRAATDFLYRDELVSMQADGFLSRLDTAFSRDQERKIYVQQRIKEKAGELYSWLERGAHFYVCGDAARMAKDVHAALLEAVASAGGMAMDKATEYVDAMVAAKRYQRDVY